MHSFLLSSLVFSSMAEAGKLEAGWRGIPYGDPSVLEVAPGSDCTPSTETAVKWSCTEAIGDVSVRVHYVVTEGLYGGVLIQCTGYEACRTLFEAVTIAWSVPFTKKYDADTSLLPDGFFNLRGRKDGVLGSWTYNRFSYEGQLVVGDMKIAEEQKRRRTAKAAAAAGSI